MLFFFIQYSVNILDSEFCSLHFFKKSFRVFFEFTQTSSNHGFDLPDILLTTVDMQILFAFIDIVLIFFSDESLIDILVEIQGDESLLSLDSFSKLSFYLIFLIILFLLFISLLMVTITGKWSDFVTISQISKFSIINKPCKEVQTKSINDLPILLINV